MLEDMYPAMLNSPATELADNINSTQTTIKVDDLSKLPDPPNIATLGTAEDCETILYESIDVANSTLTNVTRGFEGVAKAWGQGTPVHRTFTARDYEAMRQNILNLLSALGAHQQASPLDHPDGSVTATKIAEGAINALAKIAATIRTTAGGTEANRLAVTDGDGAVGLARRVLYPPIMRNIQVFESSGTFVVPDNVTKLWVEVVGGGGGGGGAGTFGSSNVRYGSGGGGGGYAAAMVSVTPSQQITVTVGAGGVQGQNHQLNGPSGTNGGDGGDSSFGDFVKASGGKGGRHQSSLGGAGGQGLVGDIKIPGSPGVDVARSGQDVNGRIPGGASFLSGATPSGSPGIGYGAGGGSDYGGGPSDFSRKGHDGVVIVRW